MDQSELWAAIDLCNRDSWAIYLRKRKVFLNILFSYELWPKAFQMLKKWGLLYQSAKAIYLLKEMYCGISYFCMSYDINHFKCLRNGNYFTNEQKLFTYVKGKYSWISYFGMNYDLKHFKCLTANYICIFSAVRNDIYLRWSGLELQKWSVILLFMSSYCTERVN